MAGYGPAPKPPEQRRNRNQKERGEWIDLPADWVGEVPPMPEREGGWHVFAAQAWESWWLDPAASQWGSADRDSVRELLVLVQEFHDGKFVHANEIRLRKDVLGLSQKGKRDLRWRVAEPEESAKPAPRPAADRRKRLKVV